MATQLTLRVGDTSAEDIPLTSSGIIVTSYDMAAPAVDQQPLANLGDGNGLSIPSWSNVTESLELHISGASAAAVATLVQSIENLLNLARQGTRGYLDSKVYLLARNDSDSEDWRSQILAGELSLNAPTDTLPRKFVRATLQITRRYYFETAAVKSIAMTSGDTTTPTTGYVTVYNDDDTHATHRNWFQIAADQIDGSIPTPLRIYLKNNSGGARSARAIYFGNYVFANPTSVDPIFRAADATGSLTTWAGTDENEVYWWDVSGNLTDSFRRQFGRLLAMFVNKPDPDTLVYLALQYRAPAPVIDLALGEQVLTGTNYVLDLGSVPLPTGGQWDTIDDVYLTIKAIAADSGGDTVTVDWVQVMPSGAGFYRVIRAIVDSLSINDQNELIDDGIEGATYLHVTSGDTALPLYRPFYEPIYAWPGRINRLRYIVQGNTSVEAGQVWQAKAECRYRRLTV